MLLNEPFLSCTLCSASASATTSRDSIYSFYPILNRRLFLSKMRREIEQDQHFGVLSELNSLVFDILRAPTLPFSFSSLLGPAVSLLSYRTSQASPSAFASLFLGISVSLMLFGSVTFVIGFLLMPFVVGFVLLFYFVGMIHKLSELGSSILWPGYTPNKDMPAWKFL